MIISLEKAADITTAPEELRAMLDYAWRNYYTGKPTVENNVLLTQLKKILAQNPNTPVDILQNLFQSHNCAEEVFNNPVFNLLMLENPLLIKEWVCVRNLEDWRRTFSPEFENLVIVQNGTIDIWERQIAGSHVSKAGLLKMISMLGKKNNAHWINIILQHKDVPIEFIARILSKKNQTLYLLLNSCHTYLIQETQVKQQIKDSLSKRARLRLFEYADILPDFITFIERVIANRQGRSAIWTDATNIGNVNIKINKFDCTFITSDYKAIFLDNLCVLCVVPKFFNSIQKIQYVLAYNRISREVIYVNLPKHVRHEPSQGVVVQSSREHIQYLIKNQEKFLG